MHFFFLKLLILPRKKNKNFCVHIICTYDRGYSPVIALSGELLCLEKPWWHEFTVWLGIWTFLDITTFAKLPVAVTARTGLLTVVRIRWSPAKLPIGVVFLADRQMPLLLLVLRWSWHYRSLIGKELTVEAERVGGVDVTRVAVEIYGHLCIHVHLIKVLMAIDKLRNCFSTKIIY